MSSSAPSAKARAGCRLAVTQRSSSSAPKALEERDEQAGHPVGALDRAQRRPGLAPSVPHEDDVLAQVASQRGDVPRSRPGEEDLRQPASTAPRQTSSFATAPARPVVTYRVAVSSR